MVETTLIHGDCLQELPKLKQGSIDLVISDVPYGTTHLEWDSVINFEVMWRELERVRKPNSPIMLFGIEPFSTKLRMSNLDNWHHDIYWDKRKPSNFLNMKTNPGKIIEIISVFSFSSKSTYNHGTPIIPSLKSNEISSYAPRGLEATAGKDFCVMNSKADKQRRLLKGAKTFPVNLIHFSKSNIPCHPTQKPVALLEYLLKIYSNPGDTVLDFTMGSGSTGVACVHTDRNFIGIEIDEKYFNIAKERIEEA